VHKKLFTYINNALKDAWTQIQKCLELSPEDPEVHFMIGEYLQSKGKHREAAKAFFYCLSYQKKIKSSVLCCIGVCSFKLGKVSCYSCLKKSPILESIIKYLTRPFSLFYNFDIIKKSKI
jgi:tetratricopeptide (TPR) repeat protein